MMFFFLSVRYLRNIWCKKSVTLKLQHELFFSSSISSSSSSHLFYLFFNFYFLHYTFRPPPFKKCSRLNCTYKLSLFCFNKHDYHFVNSFIMKGVLFCHYLTTVYGLKEGEFFFFFLSI